MEEKLIDFLLYLNEKKLINNYDFSYEDEAKQFLLCNVSCSLPTRRSKNNLPNDVKLNFVKTTLIMNCIDYYERSIIDEDEFIKRIRQIENQYK